MATDRQKKMLLIWNLSKDILKEMTSKSQKHKYKRTHNTILFYFKEEVTKFSFHSIDVHKKFV